MKTVLFINYPSFATEGTNYSQDSSSYHVSFLAVELAISTDWLNPLQSPQSGGTMTAKGHIYHRI